jgi:UDP-N-acetylmuramoyl-tripeptide--D-alanyl-D-alanine ligase
MTTVDNYVFIKGIDMTLWTSADAEAATNGNSTKYWQASGVCIDSRKVKAGDLFIAIIGENNDGHEYVAQALAAGAAAAMVNFVPENVAADAPLLVVQDTAEALWDLARFSRARLNAKVIMVTGSVGKTSTKEMLAHALSQQGKVYATEGNLNNHYGLPLTLARTPSDINFSILEVGMNHAGEISPLSVLGKPDVAIITTVEPVHLEFFDSVEGIADAKAEVFDGLAEGGVAVLNRDNPHYLRLKGKVRDGIKILSFGKGEGAEFRLTDYKEVGSGGDIKAVCQGLNIDYSLGIAGEHQAKNSLAVLAAISAIGADVKKAASSFAEFQAKAGRGKQYQIKGSFGNITLIDDTYNASPASVTAALRVLRDTKNQDGRRAIAVLGSMFELGETAEKMHVDLLQKIVENNVDIVFTAGELMNKLFAALPSNIKGESAANSAELAPKVLAALQSGDVVLVKGSRGMRMENVVNYILEEGQKKNAV